MEPRQKMFWIRSDTETMSKHGKLTVHKDMNTTKKILTLSRMGQGIAKSVVGNLSGDQTRGERKSLSMENESG